MESQDDKAPDGKVIEIPSTFTRHFGGNTPDLEYNTPVSVCFRSGEVRDGTLDDFDFNGQHSGYLSEIVGYRVRSDVLGTLGPAIGIAATKKPVKHPMDRAEPTPKATRDNPIPVDRPSEEEKLAMNIPTGDNIAVAATTPPYVKPVEQPHTYTYAAIKITEQEEPKQQEFCVGNNPDWNRDNDYKTLSDVLERAYAQAAYGKGRERHAQDLPFDQQPMQTISQLVGSCDGLRYQAIKKIQEAARLDHDAAVRELLGAINYIAGAIIYMESEK